MLKLISLFAIILLSSRVYSQVPKSSDMVAIHDYTLHYEVYGEGEPLFLLHGYTQSSVSWQPYVKEFMNDYEVYIVDLTGHGKSSPFEHDLSIRSVAHDLNYLIKKLKLDKIKAIGFSFGGDVLYQVALINPDLIDQMITIGAVGTWSIADFPEYLESFTYENREQFPWLKEAHEGDAQIKGLMAQFKNYRVRLSDEELQSINPEVLIMVGDDDEGSSLEEIFRARQNLPHSDLWILPDVTHGAHEGQTKGDFIKLSKRFFSKA